MTHVHRSILESFTVETLPTLDVAVLGALELFQEASLPTLEIPYTRPLVVGSGNAEATGRIIFNARDAVFASESTYEEKLKHIPDIDGIVLVSASGSKHAPGIAQAAREHNKHVSLVTNTAHAPAGEYADTVHVFPKNREPYTYNTSTYMGMILGHTGEDPTAIAQFITEHIDTLTMPDFSHYEKCYLIIPPELSTGLQRMLTVKFIELFGRRIARDVETSEYVAHATTVVPSDELFISFGYENDTWGKPENRLNVPLPENANFGALMAIGYYLVGQIQKAHPPYFMDNIVAYTQSVSEVFGTEITSIVE